MILWDTPQNHENLNMIKRLVLHKYNPLTLNDIVTIDITVTSVISLILGTNGSGKSSILREMSPYPASVTDYGLGGYKLIEMFYNGSTYILISLFKKHTKYYFIKDGVNLNVSGLVSAQKQLVEDYFNYTNNIHQILLWNVRFTDLTSNARKDILSEICPMDMTYVSNVFNKVREHHRDLIGALKHTNTKLGDLHLKINTITYNSELDILKKKLEDNVLALGKWITSNYNYSDLEKVIHRNLDNIQQYYTTLEELDIDSIIKSRFNTIELLISLIGLCEGRLAMSKNNLSTLENSILELRNVCDSLSNNGLSEKDVRVTLAQLITKSHGYNNMPVIENNHGLYLTSLRQLSESVIALHSNYEGAKAIYSKEEIDNVNMACFNSKSKLNGVISTRDNLIYKLNHFNSLEVITCPKCEYDFKLYTELGKDPVAFVTQKLSDVNAEMALLEVEKDELGSRLLSIQEYINCKQALIGLKRNLIMPDNFWNVFSDVDSIVLNPHDLLGHIDVWIGMVESNIDRISTLQEIQSVNNLLSIYEKYGDNLNVNELHKLEKKYSNELYTNGYLKDKLNTARINLTKLKVFNETIENIVALYSSTDELMIKLIDSYISTDASNTRSSELAKLGVIEENVNRYHMVNDQINILTNESNDLENSINIHSLLLQAISPKSGIIADQLLGFIKSFVHEINSIVQSVWNYKLEVLPCKYDNGKIDYTFPFNREGEIISDIAIGSTGQKEIINLAFILILRQYLGLSFIPLYLDETGASFDDIHRNKLLTFIKSLYESGVCEQIFMINHYNSFHNSLSTASVIVLDDTNIATPITYNTDVVINGDIKSHLNMID